MLYLLRRWRTAVTYDVKAYGADSFNGLAEKSVQTPVRLRSLFQQVLQSGLTDCLCRAVHTAVDPPLHLLNGDRVRR